MDSSWILYSLILDLSIAGCGKVLYKHEYVLSFSFAFVSTAMIIFHDVLLDVIMTTAFLRILIGKDKASTWDLQKTWDQQKKPGINKKTWDQQKKLGVFKKLGIYKKTWGQRVSYFLRCALQHGGGRGAGHIASYFDNKDEDIVF